MHLPSIIITSFMVYCRDSYYHINKKYNTTIKQIHEIKKEIIEIIFIAIHEFISEIENISNTQKQPEIRLFLRK